MKEQEAIEILRNNYPKYCPKCGQRLNFEIDITDNN